MVLRVVGPGEVADVNFASRASVVIALPWAEGGRSNTREVKSWVKVEVDGIAHGAWVARAPAAARSSRDGNEGDASGEEGAAPGGGDPRRTINDKNVVKTARRNYQHFCH